MSTQLFHDTLYGIIYDCDGVMINSRAANSLFYNRVLAYFGLPPMTEEQERYSFMATGMQALEHILPEELHPRIMSVITSEVRYERDIVPLLTLMPGFTTFVTTMQRIGIRQAMCTNRTAGGFEDVLEFFHFPRVFDPIMTVSCCEPKPSPDGARKIVAEWRHPARTILYVGDSAHDRSAAEGAGCVFCAFNGIDLDGDLVCSDYPELYRRLLPYLPEGAPGTPPWEEEGTA